jgi:LysM repeat protein
MKMPAILKRKKLRATTAARRSRSGMPALDYEEMGEPNMKLSRALLIVLLLHIVAVAGIIAFNTIKTREAVNAGSADPVASTPARAAAESAAAASPDEIARVSTNTAPQLSPVKAREPETASETAKMADPPKPKEKVNAIADSGQIYTVVRGDNPVTIARHFHVDYEALLQLNDITDPRKLQIGTKLHIPVKEESGKHKSD